MLFDAFLACTQLVEVYYRNLPDESDNHVLELAVAAGSATILTFNRRDFSRGELRSARQQAPVRTLWGASPSLARLAAQAFTAC